MGLKLQRALCAAAEVYQVALKQKGRGLQAEQDLANDLYRAADLWLDA